MAAFTHQHSSLFLDSSSPFLLLPNSSIKMSGLLEEGSCNNLSSWFPYSSPSDQFPQIPSGVNVGEYSNGGSHPVTEKQRTDSSSIVIDLDGSSDLQVTQKISPMDKKRKSKDGSCLSSAESKDTKPAKKQQKCNQKEEKKIKDEKMNKNEAPEVQPTGYVHVRARRGEATDSHSLAERVRREKISERLKMLQALVPGCDKVSSKALMLDEIINYVQSLQHQVEFLSMKLASTSPIFYDFGGVDLNSLMIKQEVSSCLTSPLQSVQQSLPTPSTTAFADITTTNITNNIPLLDSSVSLLHQQGYIPSVSSQYNGNLLWSVDEHRQRFPNQSDFTNLYSFQ